MEDNKSLPLFHRIDREIFERLDKFKQTTNYHPIQDFYNSLEEEQQKVFKAICVALIILIPALMLSIVWWQNNKFKNDLALRTSIVSKSNEIIGQKESLQQIIPQAFSSNPIDDQSMMTSRLSTILSSMGIELAKIQVKEFSTKTISSNLMKSEADFSFNNLSTDELMNMFTSMIAREKFRISALDVLRNKDTNLLQGQFHAIHYSSYVPYNSGED
jgi:hypothetical protein